MPRVISVWHLRDLWTEPPQGHLSQHKTWSNIGAAILCMAFLYETIKRGVTWDDWLGFSVALAFALSPTLVGKFLGMKYGGNNKSTITTETK